MTQLTREQSNEINRNNTMRPHDPHCMYCNTPLKAKYTTSGDRIKHSGGFWTEHMKACDRRIAVIAENESAKRWEQHRQAQALRAKRLAGLTVEGELSNDAANAILDLIEEMIQCQP